MAPRKGKAETSKNGKLTEREFILNSIQALRKPPYVGIHVVFTGFNEAFRRYFKDDPRPHVDKLVDEGVLVSRPVKGGVIIGLAEEMNAQPPAANDPDVALAKILRQHKR